MKKQFIPLIFILTFLNLKTTFAQVQDPTDESFEPLKTQAKVGEVVELAFYVTIDEGWYIYALEQDEDVMAIPTSFKFKRNNTYELVAKVQAVNPKKKFDDVWDGNITYFEKKAEYRQKVKILKPNFKIQGSFQYQTCNSKTGMCLPPINTDFTFDKSKIRIIGKMAEEAKTEDGKKGKKEEKKVVDNDTKEKNEKEESKAEVETNEDTKARVEKDVDKSKPLKTKKVEVDELAKTENQEESMLGFLLLAFGAGLIALLTPCVFPMIPMTVTFFSKNDKKKDTENLTEEEVRKMERAYRIKAIKKATFYGLSIIGIYTLLGTLVSWINGPAFANWLSTHWIPNLFFFFVFVFFALSFLGMYEIVLPHSWVSKADQQADKGGYYGIFFMAFTLSLVSFSCTGPIVGSILVQSAGGAVLKPILGMFAFSLAIAIPFSLFAAFPTWLNSLPKSGGWLNAVKVVLGFLELALALKFLSIADQVYHWRILDRDIFIALWIVIFAMIGFYLLGKVRMPHDSKLEKISVPRVVLAIVSFSFVVYLLPGLFGAPLKPLAGYLPPLSTMEGTNLYANYAQPRPENTKDFPKVKYTNFLHLPHGLQGFFDYEQAREYARKVNKPLFIDFTGHGCVNCREMEARVWAEPQVLKRLQEDYVVVALYVDEKKTLPKEQWYQSSYDDKVKKTIGGQNADFQITKFNNNAQPYYCLVNPKTENLLVKPIAYELNAEKFVGFLEEGQKAYKQHKIAAK